MSTGDPAEEPPLDLQVSEEDCLRAAAVTPNRKVSFSTLSEFSSPDEEQLLNFQEGSPLQHNPSSSSNLSGFSSDEINRGYPLTGSVSDMDIRRMEQRRITVSKSLNPYPTPQTDSPDEILSPTKDNSPSTSAHSHSHYLRPHAISPLPSAPVTPPQGRQHTPVRRRSSEPEFKRRASLGLEASLQRYYSRHPMTEPEKRLKDQSRPASPEVKETTVIDKGKDEASGYKRINKYVVIEEIGRGVHGKVKLCIDSEINTPYVTPLPPSFCCPVVVTLRQTLVFFQTGHEDCQEAKEEVWDAGGQRHGEIERGDCHSQKVRPPECCQTLRGP